MPHPLRHYATGLIAAGALAVSPLAVSPLAVTPLAAFAAPADPTPQQYSVAGIITDHAAGMPVSGATEKTKIVSARVSGSYDGRTVLLINVAGDVPRRSAFPVGWGAGTMVDGKCELAITKTEKIQTDYFGARNSFEIFRTWDGYDRSWNCVAAWTLSEQGVEQDRVFGTAYPQSAIPAINPWGGGRKHIVPVGKWVRIPVEYWSPSPAPANNVTITVEGKGVRGRTVTANELRREDKWLFAEFKVRGTRPREITVTATPSGGETKSAQVKIVPKRLARSLKPGLYHAKRGAKALRLRVTESGRVKGLRITLSISDGGSEMPTFDRFKFPGFKIPKSGYVLNDDAFKGAQRVSVLRVLDRRTVSVTGLWDVPNGPGIRFLRAHWVKK